MDWKLQLVIVPVADVDRAKDFYTKQLGFGLDVDHRAGDSFRVVQLTPPGSACSITIGTGVGGGQPGSVQGLHLIVDDIEAAYAELAAQGVATGGICHFESGAMAPGADPERRDYGSFVFFSDPDGNGWAVQEVGHHPAHPAPGGSGGDPGEVPVVEQPHDVGGGAGGQQ